MFQLAMLCSVETTVYCIISSTVAFFFAPNNLEFLGSLKVSHFFPASWTASLFLISFFKGKVSREVKCFIIIFQVLIVQR